MQYKTPRLAGDEPLIRDRRPQDAKPRMVEMWCCYPAGALALFFFGAAASLVTAFW